MALSWSRDRKRTLTHRAAADQAALARELAAPDDAPRQSKAEMRAEADALIAAYRGPIRQLPTFVTLKCYRCNHRGRARVQPGRKARFRCSKCGAASL